MVDVVVGIDVSKRRLDVLIGSKGKHFAVANDAAGLAELVGKLQGCAVKLCVLEATGGLEQAAVVHLQEQGIAVSVVNPRQARDFAKATGRLSKTDAIDARALALFGETVELRIAPPVDPRRVTLFEVGSRREQLSQMRTAEYNRLNSCEDSGLRTHDCQVPLSDAELAHQAVEQARKMSGRLAWSVAMGLAWKSDALQCPCGGRGGLVAVIDQAAVVRWILAHLGLATEALTTPEDSARLPKKSTLRGPPDELFPGDLDDAGLPVEDGVADEDPGEPFFDDLPADDWAA